MKGYFQIIAFLIITILCGKTQCYPNKTVVVYNYAPLETCDPQDRWNQDKFGGLDFPILLSILNHTGWNSTEIAFMCIANADEDIFAHSSESTIEHLLFTFDEWLTFPMYITTNYSQPYHELNFVILASYKQPLWLFFQRFDPLIFVAVVLISLILSTLMGFIVPKEQKITQLSDYVGLIFFQPNIIGRRNISHKIVSLFFMFTCLIINNYFTTMLQEELDDFKSFGGRSLDNGLNGVWVWTEGVWIQRLMYTLVKPNDLHSYYFDLPVWRAFIMQHPGETFLTLSSMGNILLHENCNLRLMGDFIYTTNVIAIAPIPREQYTELNAAIVDVTKSPLYPYIPNYEVEILMPIEDIKCKTPRKIGKQFQYTVQDFIVLWILYAGAAIVALLLKLFFKIKEYYYGWKNMIYSETIINDRATYLAQRISSSVEISLFWLIIYQRNFVNPLCANKMKKIREFFKDADQNKKIIHINKTNASNKNIEWITKIEQSRKKVIRLYLDMHKNIYIRIVLKTLLSTMKAEQKKNKLLKNKSLLNLTKQNKSKKSIKITEGKKYLAKLVDSSLKECLIKAMSLFNFSDAQPKPNVIRYVQKIGFQTRERLKLKLLNNVHYIVNESFHMKMVDIFYSKIIRQIINRAYSRGSYKKLIKHKDQITRLVKKNRRLPIRDLFVMLMDVIVFLRTDKATKNKQKKLKRVPVQGVNVLPILKVFKKKYDLVKLQNLEEGTIQESGIINIELNSSPDASPINHSFQNMANLDECIIQSAYLVI